MSDQVIPAQRTPVTTPVVSEPALVIPEAPALGSRTYASPMRYVGSFRRMTAWVRKIGWTPLQASLAWTLGGIYAAVMWIVVLPVYYFVTLILFGAFMIPYRLVRRSHRKQEHLQQAQLATMQTMLVQQQQVMLEQQRRGGMSPSAQ